MPPASKPSPARKPRPAPPPARGRGRPARAGAASTIGYELRLAPEERARWQSAADAAEVSLAQLIREAVEARLARGGAR